MITKNLTPTYINRILSKYFINSNHLKVVRLEGTNLRPGLISGLASQIIRIALEYEVTPPEDYPITMILKANPSDKITHQSMQKYAQKSRSLIPVSYISNLRLNYREIMSYRHLIGQVDIGMPEIYHTVLDETHNKLYIFMEDLQGALLLDTDMDREAWSEKWLFKAMGDLASFHISWWNRTENWSQCIWLFKDPPKWIEHTKFAVENNRQIHPQYITADRYKLLKEMIDRLPYIDRELNSTTKALIHGDCSPRNACFQIRNGVHRLTLFDWSFTGVSHPGQDIAAFLLYILSPFSEWDLMLALLRYYFSCVPESISQVTYEEFYRGFVLSEVVGVCSKLMACAWNEPTEIKWLFRDLSHNLEFLEKTKSIWCD